MKSKKRGKSSGAFGRRYRTRVAVNIAYSASAAVLADILLVANLSALAGYAAGQEWDNALLTAIYNSDLVIVLGYVLVGIFVFSVCFLLLQEKSLRYISRIAEAVGRISDGDLNTVIEVAGDDEFSSMAANLNRMVGDIRVLMDKERESERTKNELITNVAHDLRTPLTSLTGYLELLCARQDLPEETRRKYLDIAYGKAKRLEKLIEDLFSFTKLTYGKITMHVTRVDIVKLLGQLLEEAYPGFARAGISYELVSNVPAKVISADGNLLARLFDNLINNAVKYGAEGKRVIVEVAAGARTVDVSVKNYGYVIPQEELPLIFEKFYRVERSRSASTGGTGLGLAIVKSIADMHGGSVAVRSDLNGTVFTVTLRVDFDVNKEQFGEAGVIR